jgi:heptosyltransferase-1
MNILIVKTSSMGDVLHTIPAARALRRAFPQAHLGWAVEKAHSEVLRGQSWLDERIVWNRSGAGNFIDFIRHLRSQKWDMALDFQGLFRSGLITRLSGAARRIGYAPTRERAHWFYTERVPQVTMERHAVERYLDLAAHAGAAPRAPLPRPYLAGLLPSHAEIRQELCDEWFPLVPSEEDRHAVDAWLAERRFDPARHRLAILNPHCRKNANRWPAERFAELARRLSAQQGLKVALTGGPATRDLCDQIQRLSGEDLWRADGQFGLLGSAELFRRSAVIVTGDTGPMHIAVAVGLPVVAIFGPANPLRTGPYASDAIVLREPLECSPCFAGSRCPLGHAVPKCLDLIDVERVLASVARQLARARRKSA